MISIDSIEPTLVYKANFQPVLKANKLPYQDLILKHGFYIAGGAAAALIWDIPYNDIDLFMINEADPATKIKNFLDELKGNAFRKNEHCLTIEMKDYFQIQIIFYNHKSMQEVVDSFDLGSCSYILGLDGKIYTNKEGEYTYKTLRNRVNPNTICNTSEKRLVKYYKRGFSIEFPYLKLNKGYNTFERFNLFVKDGAIIEFNTAGDVKDTYDTNQWMYKESQLSEFKFDVNLFKQYQVVCPNYFDRVEKSMKNYYHGPNTVYALNLKQSKP